MEKKDIANKLAEEYNITKKDALSYVNMVFDCVKESLADDETVDIFGFGKFTVVERSARMGLNPQTKEKMEIAATKAVKFKPSKVLKEAVK